MWLLHNQKCSCFPFWLVIAGKAQLSLITLTSVCKRASMHNAWPLELTTWVSLIIVLHLFSLLWCQNICSDITMISMIGKGNIYQVFVLILRDLLFHSSGDLAVFWKVVGLHLHFECSRNSECVHTFAKLACHRFLCFEINMDQEFPGSGIVRAGSLSHMSSWLTWTLKCLLVFSMLFLLQVKMSTFKKGLCSEHLPITCPFLIHHLIL